MKKNNKRLYKNRMENKSDKYLFLDIDGVLNCGYSFKRDKGELDWGNIWRDINLRNLKTLEYFVKHTPDKIHIILSSSWRNIPACKKRIFKLFETETNMKIEDVTINLNYGSDLNIKDVRCEEAKKYIENQNKSTKEKYRWNLERGYRGDEIQYYLDKHGIAKENIIIFDDDCDMLHLNERLIKTSFRFDGLCYRHLIQAWELLYGRDKEDLKKGC